MLLGWVSMSVAFTLVDGDGEVIGPLDGALEEASIGGPPDWLNNLVNRVVAFRLDGKAVTVTALPSEPAPSRL
jgi:hypothetical protein